MSAVLLSSGRSIAALPKLRAAACRRALRTDGLHHRLQPIAAQFDGEAGENWDDAADAPSTTALHAAVLAGRLDFALHRLRDLCAGGTVALPEGLILAALLPREDARDAVVLAPDTPPVFRRVAIPELPVGACLGLSSARREAQLRHLRPDLRFRALPGEAAARLRALRNGDQSATVLSMAALHRLSYPRDAVLPLDVEVMVPAAGQGILAVTARTADAATHRLLHLVDDAHSRAAWEAEAAVLRAFGAGAPVATSSVSAHARMLPGGLLRLCAAASGPSGLRRVELAGPRDEAGRLGTRVGEALRGETRARIAAA